MKHIVVAIIAVIVGCYIVINRSKWANKAIDQQNKAFHFRFGKKDIQATSYVGLLVGVGFIVVGLLTLVGVIEPKW